MNRKTSDLIARAEDRQRKSWEDAARGNASWFTFFSDDITPTSGMSAGLMEIPPNGGILKPHRHAQAEIYFVAEGSGLLTIDGVETPISAGTSAFIPGDAEHAVRNVEATPLKIFYVFPIDRFAEVVYRFSAG